MVRLDPQLPLRHDRSALDNEQAPPLVGRINEGLLLLDPRTVPPELDAQVVQSLKSMVPVTARSLHDGEVLEGNCLDTITTLPARSVDLILTSPPYVNAIDYPRAHKFSEWWLSPGAERCMKANYIGLRTTGRDPSAAEEARKLAETAVRRGPNEPTGHLVLAAL